MCREDLQLGARRYAVAYPKTPGAFSLPGNKQRVILRITVSTTAAAESVVTGVPTGQNIGIPLMYVNQGKPVDEIYFEDYGSLVQAEWSFSGGGNFCVTEVIDPDLPQTIQSSTNPLMPWEGERLSKVM